MKIIHYIDDDRPDDPAALIEELKREGFDIIYDPPKRLYICPRSKLGPVLHERIKRNAHAIMDYIDRNREGCAMNPQREQWILTFRADGPGQNTAMRVKLLLKAALRRFGLRCTDYRVEKPDGAENFIVPGFEPPTVDETSPCVPHNARSAGGMICDTLEDRTRQNQSMEGTP